MLDLSVIIVSYNVRRFLEQTILSVQRACNDLQVEIIVVDNASYDDSCLTIRNKYPQVKLIENTDNVGFSRANNQGIKISQGKYVLLLNPDTVLAEDTLSQCFHFMENTADCGALGVRMVDGGGVFLPESKRGLPTPTASFYKIFGLASLFPKSEKFGSYHLKYLDEFQVNQVDVLSGAFMFLRKEALDKSGLLDETFFMYGEDIDLSYRITLAGYKNYYFPETTIIHYKGESTKKNSLNYVKVFYQAMIIFAEKHFGVKSGKLFGQLIYVAVYLRAFAALLKRVVVKGLPLFAEFVLLYLSYLSITRYWEEYNKWVAGGAYPQEYFIYHLTCYVFILILGLLLGGAYKKYFSGNSLWKGIFIGTSLLVICYAFLPETLRYSRAILLLGAFIGLSILTVYRSVLNFVVNRSFSLGNNKMSGILIVGEPDQVVQVTNILQSYSLGRNVLGVYSPSKEGGLDKLDSYIDFYKVEEVIMSNAHISNKHIIALLSKKYSRKIDFKILPEHTHFIIGSTHKNKSGSYYTEEIQFALGNRNVLRNKRIFDVVVAIMLIPILPFTKRIGQEKWKQLWSVFKGEKTWVGYNLEGNLATLPQLKSCVFQLKDSLLDKKSVSHEFLEQSNVFYARNYHWKQDLDIIGKVLFF